MRPEEYLLIIVRRWWLVVLAALAAAAVGFGVTASQPRTYQASTNLMAIAQPPDYWMDLYAKNRLASYTDLINNWDFVATALQQAHLNVTPAQAMSGLSVGHDPTTNTLQIVETDTNPQRAAQVVNAVANAFVARSAKDNQQIVANYPLNSSGQKTGTVEIVKLGTPSAPTTPVGPRTKLNTGAAALLGCVFGVLLTFGAEYLDDSLRTEQDVNRYLSLPTVTMIPHGSTGR
ncbi:MAG TPA: hypothetical protein VFN57_16850 [Thermomicrobiaceae bacterium]|nr:hypothetical protein [Thermomicrobiaceae bacterium]